MTPAASSPTALRGPAVYLARAGWLVLAAACVLLFIDSTFNTARLPLPRCAAPAACPAATQITHEDAEIAAALGLSIPLLPLSLAASITARLSLAAVGLLIVWRRSNDWVALVISGALMTVLLEGNQGISPVFHTLQGLLLGIGSALFLPIPFIFPNGRFEPRWMRWPVLILTSLYATLATVFPITSVYAPLFAVLTLLWIGLAGYAMPYRYFRVSGPIERQQIKWVLLGITASFFTASYYTAVSVFYPLTQPSPARLIALLINLPLYAAGYGFFAFAMLVAMLRHRLWDIDVILRRTLIYSALTALLALTYFGLVISLQGLVTAAGGRQAEWITVASTLTVAALFLPLRNRVQAFIDQRFYRRKYDAARVLSGFAATARDETDLTALTGQLAGVVQATMEPESVTVWLRPERPGLAEAGRPGPHLGHSSGEG